MEERDERAAAPVLLLGGTEEGHALATLLAERGVKLVVSLTDAAAEPYPGIVRRGGFGGVEAMAEFLREQRCAVVVDATDPFAAVISPTAKRAARAAGARYFRLERRPWRRSAADRWTDVRTPEAAAEQIDQGARVMLAIGSAGLGPFLRRRDLALVVRVTHATELGPRHDVTVVRDGPSAVEDERALFARHAIDALVVRNTGEDSGAAMLLAARERRTHVYMIVRPPGQPWASARTAEAMMRKLRRHLR